LWFGATGVQDVAHADLRDARPARPAPIAGGLIKQTNKVQAGFTLQVLSELKARTGEEKKKRSVD
jgi:hypothetical protein